MQGRIKKSLPTNVVSRLFLPEHSLKLCLYLLLDSQLATVETALWAYTVIEDCRTTVRAGYNCWNNSLVVSSTLVSTG